METKKKVGTVCVCLSKPKIKAILNKCVVIQRWKIKLVWPLHSIVAAYLFRWWCCRCCCCFCRDCPIYDWFSINWFYSMYFELIVDHKIHNFGKWFCDNRKTSNLLNSWTCRCQQCNDLNRALDRVYPKAKWFFVSVPSVIFSLCRSVLRCQSANVVIAITIHSDHRRTQRNT